MVTAAGDRTTRRRGKRRPEPETAPVDVGDTLRSARLDAGVTLAEVHDRTGIPWLQLEALEAGELDRLPDRRSALLAVRRYADLLDLDAGELTRATDSRWSSTVGAAMPVVGSSNGGFQRGSAGGAHLSRYPGDGSHLRAFTQTGQIPGVGRSSGGSYRGRAQTMDHTGVFAAVPAIRPYVRPAPLGLRVAVWTTAGLVAVGLLGLAVSHWQRQWLADIHVIHGPDHPGTSSGASFEFGPGSPSASSSPSSSSSSSSSATVSQTDSGPGVSAVTVRAADFAVVVAASQPCWVSASTPQSFQPIFQGTLQSGQTTTLDSANGQLTVQLGARQVALAVKIGGKLVPGWLFQPSSAPYTLNFTSASSG